MNQLNLNKIKNRYLLYVGNSYPHKNLDRLVSAFEIVIKNNPDLLLILVGKIDYFYQKLQKKVEDSVPKDQIIFTNEISDQELTKLYQNALVYVFPSLSEGFGLPGLEAMKYGLPVACSNYGPLPEVYETAAIYFDPKDPNDIADKILRIISNAELREQLKQKGYNQVKKYSWEKCAKETIKIYEQNNIIKTAKRSF